MKTKKTEAEWREILTPEQYRVTRQHGTEAPFSGLYSETKDDGSYHCICCDQELFTSRTKYDSGTGWPSFWAPVRSSVVEEHTDRSLFMRRTEIRCSGCDAHLGHVFPDGPEPTGMRYCMNSASLNLRRRSLDV